MPVTPSSYLMKKEEVKPEWYVLDVDGLVVGRIATKIAQVLMGKHKPTYTPNVECGDFVVVLNVDKIRFSGKPLAHSKHPYYTTKMAKKDYDRYTGYPSGLKFTSAIDVWQRHPERILIEAVRRMLPKNKLRPSMLKKLKCYTGTEHPHQAQQPVDFPDYLRS